MSNDDKFKHNMPIDEFSAENYQEEEIDDDLIADDAVLSFAQKQRMLLVKSITKDGMPHKNTDRLAMLQALNDMSSQAHGNKRLKVDSEANEGNKQVFAIAAQLAAMFPQGPVNLGDGPGAAAPDDEIELIEVDQDVISTSIKQESAAQFLERVDKK